MEVTAEESTIEAGKNQEPNYESDAGAGRSSH